MKKLFNINMTWKKVIIFAIVTGIYTGIVTLIPILKDTSFRDISISFEWWILFGIMIIMGSKSNKDSALKCFLFFLISQPLVYLVQVPFNGFSIFMYYKNWILWTIATIPMGYIGYYIKKDNLLSLAILTPVLVFLGYHLYNFSGEAINYFPNHLLSSLFCIITMFLYIYGILSKKRERLIGTIICSIIVTATIVINLLPNNREASIYKTILICESEELKLDLNTGVYTNDDLGKVYISEQDFGYSKPYCIMGEFNKIGETSLKIKIDGNEYNYHLEVKRGTYNLEKE